MKGFGSILLGILLLLGWTGFGDEEPNLKTISPRQLREMVVENTRDVVVLHYWASWCPPCLQEFPVFVRLRRQFTGKSLDVIFVSVDFPETMAAAMDFLRKKGVDWTTFATLDQDPGFLTLFNEDWSGGLPATFVLKPKSPDSLLFFREGTTTFQEIQALVQQLLAEPEPTKPANPKESQP